MEKNITKSMYNIHVKNVNLIILTLFAIFLLTFSIIEFNTEYLEVKKELKMMNQTKEKKLISVMEFFKSYNDFILQNIAVNREIDPKNEIDPQIINNLVDHNFIIENLVIMKGYKNFIYMYEECDCTVFEFEHPTPNHNNIIKTSILEQYNIYKYDQDHVYVVYKFEDYHIFYKMNLDYIKTYLNLSNSDFNFLLQNQKGEVLFTDFEVSKSYRNIKGTEGYIPDHWYEELVYYSTVQIYDTDYLLINTVNFSYLLTRIFNHSYLTITMTSMILVTSLLISRKKIYNLTTKPFNSFINDMEQLSEVDYTSILSLEPSDKTYNEFAKLLNEFKKIVLYNENEQKKVIEEYKNKLNLALDSSNSKSIYLANMSHEMRTPLNAIIGYMQLSKKVGFEDKDKIKEYFDRINTSSEILLQKINDILDLSKMEAKQFELNTKPINIKNLIRELYDLLAIQAQMKNIEFSYYIDPQIPKYLVIDEIRLKQILLNLCNNAIKFTDQGSVKLVIELFGFTNDSIVLDYKIIDTGCGIPKDQIDKIFLPFVQIDQKNSKQVGTGLGLTISQELIRLMGGEINVTSKENGGSIFSFTTIFKISELNSQEVQSIVEISNEEFERIIKNIKILIAEDNIINQIFMKEIFNVYHKNDIEFASNGIEAFNMCKNKKYDLILMDIQMPKMSGVEATIQIRSIPYYKTKPIIALTANAFAEQIREYLALGMTDFLPKPVDIGRFKKIITKYFI